jgi:hypothetical protein
MYQINNSVTFSGKPMTGFEEFLNQMVEALGINRKNRMCPYFKMVEQIR